MASPTSCQACNMACSKPPKRSMLVCSSLCLICRLWQQKGGKGPRL
jgi:hypothetical protein